jgi:hypothetical protein
MPLPKPAGKGKTEEINLDSASSHILEECRMVLPGIQALFGFQLIAVFNERFAEELSQPERYLHFAAIALVAVAIALIMTPAAMHRRIGVRRVTDAFIDASTRLLLASMVPLALAISLEFYLIGRMVLKDGIAAPLAMALLVLFGVLWVGNYRLVGVVRSD